jgi:hypothetical protein
VEEIDKALLIELCKIVEKLDERIEVLGKVVELARKRLCRCNMHSSRSCELGTEGCIVDHSKRGEQNG